MLLLVPMVEGATDKSSKISCDGVKHFACDTRMVLKNTFYCTHYKSCLSSDFFSTITNRIIGNHFSKGNFFEDFCSWSINSACKHIFLLFKHVLFFTLVQSDWRQTTVSIAKWETGLLASVIMMFINKWLVFNTLSEVWTKWPNFAECVLKCSCFQFPLYI